MIAVDDRKMGMAQSGRRYPHQHLAAPWRIEFDHLDREWAGFVHRDRRHRARTIPQPRLSSAFCVSCLGPRAYRVADEANRGKWSDNDAYGQINNAIYYLWFDTVVDAWLIESELLDVSAGDPMEIGLGVQSRHLVDRIDDEPVWL